MRQVGLLNDPSRAWEPYRPGEDGPWDAPRVAHLHRRAGFRPSWGVIDRDVKEGFEASVERLLQGEPSALDGRPAAEFDAELDAMAARFAESGPDRPAGVWLYRMIFTPNPLRERMTLFWHNHFATSNAKVDNPALMRRQNALLRSHALGDFKSLLKAMAKDPAMLLWLDSATNRKARPNENYAREVMELFTLGRGKYTEKDVQEAARAFTGSFIQADSFHEVLAQHDDGAKTVLGRTGAWRGDDVAEILLDQPACAEFLARKLFRLFFSDVDEPPPDLLAPLAQAYRASGYETMAAVRLILRSRLFHDPGMRRRRVSSPVEFVVGTIRALEVLRPTLGADGLARAASGMGQTLFAPPSVAGWDGGQAWINTTATLARTNFILALANDAERFDAERLTKRYRIADPARFHADLLVQDAFDASVRSRIKGTAKEAAVLVLTSPEYQLA